MSSIHVIKPGLQTTVQDGGRWGWQSRGVSVSGAMDQASYRIANALVGNPVAAAVLEIAFVGPELEFEDDRVVAVTGAEFVMTLDGESRAALCTFEVHAGTRLRFADRRRGSRAYLAIAGGIAVPKVLGSRSTHLASRMGGLGGRALVAGDRLPVGGADVMAVGRAARIKTATTSEADTTPENDARRNAVRVRVIPDSQLDRFVDGTLEALQVEPYTIGHQSDRMGFRLEGQVLRHTRGADIISDATPIGTLQVPASGQPILLMADRQTTGGYTRIATVIAADLPIVGQMGPGDRIAFAICTLDEARSALVARERALLTVEERARA